MKNLLREYIKIILESSKDLLTEPDDSEGEESEEASVSGAVAGVTTPLGTGPNHPKKSREKTDPITSASKNFANAKLVKTKR